MIDKALEKLISFSKHIKEGNFIFECKDYIDLIKEDSIDSNTFIYFDPPYKLMTGSYNDGKRGFKGWNDLLEEELFEIADNLTKRKIKFMFILCIRA